MEREKNIERDQLENSITWKMLGWLQIKDPTTLYTQSPLQWTVGVIRFNGIE